MPVSEAQRQALVALAAKHGVAPEAVTRRAEALLSEETPAGADTGNAPPQDSTQITKVFQWNSWFLRVRELRESMGFHDRIHGDEMMCGEFLALHGPPTSQTGAPNDTKNSPPNE